MFPNFKDWIVNFKDEISPRGKFATDVFHDTDFPSGVQKSEIESYLLNRGADIYIMDLFHTCWHDYKKEYGAWFI